ncbi:MAG TPA: NAD-dependent epimerase/dehydratase family protein [Candidatus Saccharimonadales bacterium]|nr:NAD-dependent epimerase/dehydratase family protein [Candidatus Saccharimonadales bacterium]
MTTVLVTGGAGFIGSHLVERLLGRGDRVVVLDNLDPFYDPGLKRENLRLFEGNGAFRFEEGDIRDGAALERLFSSEGFDAVVHLAARAGVRPSIAEPILYSDVNLNGTVHLLEACRLHGVRRFVFGSSSSVYGNANKVPFSEDDPVERPVSPYAATKAAGELLCHAYHRVHGFDVTCLRFFTVYGPRQRPEMAIHKFARMILDGEPIPRFGDGSSERDYTYVDDIIDGVIASLDRLGGYHVYNLGESRRISLGNLIRLLEREIGIEASVTAMPDQPGDVRTTWADVSRARKELDYEPRVPIEEGVRRFVAWLRLRRGSGESR